MDIIGNRKWGMISLCGFLVLEGIFTLTNVRFEHGPMIQGVLATIAGILLFLDK